MHRGPVPTDERLRHLLQSGRRTAGLSQRQAAGHAGISAVYWQKIESGAQPTAPCGTLAAMCAAAGITAERLHAEGYPAIAVSVAERASLAAREISPEDHLAATPGASDEEITVLQAVWLALRAKRTTDPLETDFTDHSKRRRQQKKQQPQSREPADRVTET